MSAVKIVIEFIQQIADSLLTEYAEKITELKRLIATMKQLSEFAEKHHLQIHAENTLDGSDEKGLTPMMWASKLGLIGVMEILQTEGAKLDSVDQAGMNAAHHAAFHGQLGALQFLCSSEEGKKLLKKGDTITGATPFFLAAATGKASVVTYLVHEQKADVEESLCMPNGTYDFDTKAVYPLVVWMLDRYFLQHKYPQIIKENVSENKLLFCLEALKELGAPFKVNRIVSGKRKQTHYRDPSASALCLAAENGFSEIIQLMGKAGVIAEARPDGLHALFYALGLGSMADAKKLTPEQCIKTFEELLTQETLPLLYTLPYKYLGSASAPSFPERFILMLQSKKLHKLDPSFVSKAFEKYLNESTDIDLMKAYYNAKLVTQEMADNTLISLLNGLDSTKHLCSSDLNNTTSIKCLMREKPTPSLEAQTTFMKKFMEQLMEKEGRDISINFIETLMVIGFDPLIQNKKGWNIFECIINKCKSQWNFSRFTQTSYDDLGTLLRLPNLKENPGVKKYCQERFSLAQKEQDAALVSFFKNPKFQALLTEPQAVTIRCAFNVNS